MNKRNWGPRSVYVPNALWVRLQAILRREGRSVSAWAREQAENYVERQRLAGQPRPEQAISETTE